MSKINFPQPVKINRQSYVMLPLKVWQDFEDAYEMFLTENSPRLKKEIAQAREDIRKGRFITLEEYNSLRVLNL